MRKPLEDDPPPRQSALLTEPVFDAASLKLGAAQFRQSCSIVQHRHSRQIGIAIQQPDSETSYADSLSHFRNNKYHILGTLPPLYPEWLGDRSFTEIYQVRFPYIGGEMAQGIASPDLVIAMANANILAFFGSGGLDIENIERGIKTIKQTVDPNNSAWGANLIHSPQEPYLEQQSVDCFLSHGVNTVSASAFMRLGESIIRYACTGLHTDNNGQIIRPNKVLAKVSRPEVASQFMKPAPEKILKQLIAKGTLSHSEAGLARQIPVAEDITVEADSGGHTDNRPLVSLLPTILMLRDEISLQYQFQNPIRVGAAGGIGSPGAAASAFSMGADYIVTGSVNQTCIEAGQSDLVKQMLAQQGIADVAMAPAADMFELGVKLQVAKRGSLFAPRAIKLYDLYRSYDSLEAIPDKQRQDIETNIFRKSLQSIWEETKTFWHQRHPQTLDRAEAEPKYKMALVFRWYLGKSADWARAGVSDRQTDFQIWSGPATGSFNTWCKDSFLAHPSNRSVVQVAFNLMEGAASITRAQQLRSYGVPMPSEAFNYKPVLFN